MITACPAPAGLAAHETNPRHRPPSPPEIAADSWRYPCTRRSRGLLATAVALSIAVHVGVLFGIRPPKARPTRAPAREMIAVTLALPNLKELEEPEPEPPPTDESGTRPDLGLPVPMQADLPQIPRPNDFVQALDFASLLEKPDFSQTNILSVPENIRRGSAKLAESIGRIFNLEDLDRVPEPVFQPSPVYPFALRRQDVTARVIVEFIVDPLGHAVNAFVVESTNRAFDEAATSGVQKWKFRPGLRAGQKVNTRMRVPISFTLLERLD